MNYVGCHDGPGHRRLREQPDVASEVVDGGRSVGLLDVELAPA